MNSLRKSILRVGPCLIAFILPLAYFGDKILYPHIAPKQFFFYGVVEILAGLFIYSLIIDKSYRIPKKVLIYFLPIIGFLVWMTVAAVLATDPSLSFWSTLSRGTGLLTLYHSLLFSLIITSLTVKEGKPYIYKLFKWFVGGGFLLSLSLWFGSGGFNLPIKFLRTDGGGGMTGNSSVAAVYLMFIIAFAIFLLISKEVSYKAKWFVGVAIATIIFSPIFVNIHGLLTGGSLLGNARGALLGIIVGIGATGLGILCLSAKKSLRILGLVGIVASIIIFSFGWKQLVTNDTYLHQKFTEQASGTRFIFWDTAQKAMNEHKWFGYGPENQMIAFQANFNPKMLLKEYSYEGYTDRFHNIYYDLGAGAGYPVIALYILFILSIIFALYKLKQKGIFSSLQSSIFFGLITGYVFQNLFFFDSTLSFMILFVFIGTIYALQDNIPKEIEKAKPLDPYFRNMLAIILIIGCAFSFVYFSYKPLQKLSAFGRVFSKQINKPFNELLVGSSVGNMWDVGGLAHDTFRALSASAVAIKGNKEVLPYIQSDLDNLLKYLEIIKENNPYDFRLHLGIVNLYNTKIFLSGKPIDESLRNHMLEILSQSRNLSPTNPEVYWGMAQVYLWSGDIKNAQQAYQQAIAIDPSIPVSHQFLIKFAKNINNQNLYKEALAQAQKDIPGFTIN
jgi:O-antigen ligase